MQNLQKRYFYLQQLSFEAVGIDPRAKHGQWIIKRPILCFGPMFCSFLHCLAIVHFAYVNINDYIEVTESLSIMCQLVLAFWKMLIFLSKRNKIVQFVRDIHLWNLKAKPDELSIIRKENAKDILICAIYFVFVISATVVGLIQPILNAIYGYFKSGELVLRPPHKATYFWNYSHITGYAVVFIWNVFSLYFIVFASLAIDCSFSWLICNIMAKFRILNYRFHQTAFVIASADDESKINQNLKLIISCVQYHRKTLQLTTKLNQVYGEIIFFKVLISCSQICFLAFRLSRSLDAMPVFIHDTLFLIAVAIQLMLYCFNGQRIQDESMQVASEIYAVFKWNHLRKSYIKLLLMPMMRSQKSNHLRGVFFTVDLNLYLWIFKTAGSLITALKTLESNQK